MPLGVFSREWLEPLANVLLQLGAEGAWVVHGSDGLDEMTTTGPTHVAELKDGSVRTFEITPEEAGLERAEGAALKGGDADSNAAALRAVLGGESSAYRDIVVLNAAGALVVAGAARDLAAGAKLASDSLAQGKAKAALDQMVAIATGSG